MREREREREREGDGEREREREREEGGREGCRGEKGIATSQDLLHRIGV